VTDEIALTKATERAAQAQRLLDDKMLSEAFKGLEEAYTAAWRQTTIDDVSGREKLFLAINIVGKVRDHLRSIVSNGNVAQAELNEIAKVAERKKAWHEIKP
jgi:hypothetical protein